MLLFINITFVSIIKTGVAFKCTCFGLTCNSSDIQLICYYYEEDSFLFKTY